MSQQIAISKLPAGINRLNVQAVDSRRGHAESPNVVFTVQ